jgi:hypothetical protein
LLIPVLSNKIARMPRKLHKILILFLGLLQTLTPLAHAHAGTYDLHQGLHVPGLESYRSSHDAPVLTGIKSDGNDEGLLVMVDAGIKSPQPVSVKNQGSLLDCLVLALVLSSFLCRQSQNFSPHCRQSYRIYRYYPPQSPRAPPV